MQDKRGAPDWFPFHPARWIAGTSTLDYLSEYVFFRLCVHAYEKGSSEIKGSDKFFSALCKQPDAGSIHESLALLLELEKIERTDKGYSIPVVEKYLDDVYAKIGERRQRSEKARTVRQIMRERDCNREEANRIYDTTHGIKHKPRKSRRKKNADRLNDAFQIIEGSTNE